MKILGQFWCLKMGSLEYMEDSYQNPDHPADAEVGWKCDEFLSGCSFYAAFTRRAVAQISNQVATGPALVCGCAIRLLQKSHL